MFLVTVCSIWAKTKNLLWKYKSWDKSWWQAVLRFFWILFYSCFFFLQRLVWIWNIWIFYLGFVLLQENFRVSFIIFAEETSEDLIAWIFKAIFGFLRLLHKGYCLFYAIKLGWKMFLSLLKVLLWRMPQEQFEW